MQLGDSISSVATPIARALNLDCIDPQTNDLRPESPCAKRRNALNQFSESVYDWLFQPKQKGNNNMTDETKKPWQVMVTLENAEDLFDVVKQLSSIQDKPGIKVAEARPRPQPQAPAAPQSKVNLAGQTVK